MGFTDDPVADFERYDAEREWKLNRLPVCWCCGEHIQQEDAITIRKLKIGKIRICDGCASNREEIEDAV